MARYSTTSGLTAPFPAPAAFARAIAPAAQGAWVGTSEGLYWFSRSPVSWSVVPDFQGSPPSKIQALAVLNGDVYAGTLGRGLYRLRAGRWLPVRQGKLPGDYVTCLSPDSSNSLLLVGTIASGLLILDPRTDSFQDLGARHAELAGQNVTAALPDTDGTTWIATYGNGLFASSGDRIDHFTHAGGQIGDDWVLALCQTPNAIYAGSLGGGVSVFSKSEHTWGIIDIAQGLPSADVTSIAYIAPYLYFGTLGGGVVRYLEVARGAAMARSFGRTWVYVAREFLFSFLVAFLFFFFIFFVNQILVMAEQIFSKRVPFWDVVRLVVYSLPIVVALSFPFGSLVGALMAVGRLASDQEILAFSVLGVPPRQLLIPLLFLGLAFSGASFVMNDYFFPLGSIRFAEIYRRILYSNPGVELEPRSIKKYEDTIIITGGVEGNQIRNILIMDKVDGNRRVITAENASIAESTENQGVISLKLGKVFSEIAYPKEGDRFDYFQADSMVYSILLKNITSSIGSLSPTQQSSVDVWRQIVKMESDQSQRQQQKDQRVASLTYGLASAIRSAREEIAADPAKIAADEKNLDAIYRTVEAEENRDVSDATLQSYLVEFHRKFSLPAGCLFFAFFAFPIGLLARRSGRTVGFAVGLLVSILYYGLLLLGQTFGARMDVPAAASMWLPDAIVFAAGVVLFTVRRAR